MDIKSFLMRLFIEQKWREQEAQKMSTGIGYNPYNFTDAANMQFPNYMDALKNADEKDARRDNVIQSMERVAKSPVPDWFHERWRQREWQQSRQEGLDKIFKHGI